jgi:hypothetical protein
MRLMQAFRIMLRRGLDMWRSVRMMVLGTAALLAGCAEWALEPEPEACPPWEEVLAAAEAGDGKAAFFAYQQATTDAERRKWLCISANRNFGEAQAEIARLHWGPPGMASSIFERDKRKAYVWSIIAMRNHQPVEHMEDRIGCVIPDDERWQATVFAVSWKPDPAQCENMEESGYFSPAPPARGGASF